MSLYSVSASDLSMSPVSSPLKHPAFVNPVEFREPGRHNSLPHAWRHRSSIPAAFYSRSSYGSDRRLSSTNKTGVGVRRGGGGGGGSIREASKSLMNIHRQADPANSNNSNNTSPTDSDPDSHSIDSGRRSPFWSTTSLLYFAGVPTPRIKQRHLFCQIPEHSSSDVAMDRGKGSRKRVAKSPSVDSGTGSGSGSMRRRHPIASPPTIRKRRGSSGSASSTSSSGLSGFKDSSKAGGGESSSSGAVKAQCQDPASSPVAEVKKRSSFVSALMNRKHSKSPTKTKSIEQAAGASLFEGTGPSSPTPSSSSSARVSSSIRESFKAAKNLLSHSSTKINNIEQSPKSTLHPLNNAPTSSSGNSPKISDVKDGGSEVSVNSNNTMTMTNTSQEKLPPVKPRRSNSWKLTDSMMAHPVTLSTIPDDTPEPQTLQLSPSKTQSTKAKSQGKKGLGKLFSKKNKNQDSTTMLQKTAAPGQTLPLAPSTIKTNNKSSILKADIKNSPPDIVNFESEPRKLTPKSKVFPTGSSVPLGTSNRGYNEMEVSEEAVARARKLREEKEAAEKSLLEVTNTAESKQQQQQGNNNSEEQSLGDQDSSNNTLEQEDVDYIRTGKSRKELIAESRVKFLTATKANNESTPEESSYDASKTVATAASQDLSAVVQQRKAKDAENGDDEREDSAREDSGGETDIRDERQHSGELPHHHRQHDGDTSLTPDVIVVRHHEEDSDEDPNDKRNTSSLSRHEQESGIGNESPMSSLDVTELCEPDDPLHNRSMNNNEEEQVVPGQFADTGADEAEADEEDASLATTVTTDASEMDASFMLSRSLALTEDEFSYTESFKQLKPFNFDHVEPILEGKRERLYKVLVVGELGTGKTSIIKRYVHQFFSQHYRATIGVDFALKVLRWDPETVVRLQLWDIAGQERFGSMTRVYYKEAVGAFVVFDVTRGATLEAVPKWKADLDAKVVLPDGRPIPTVLLANKSDQPKEGIAANRDKMNEFCAQQGFSAWFETSAKDNINIDESANFLVSKILEMDKWSQEPMSTDPEKLDLSANGKHKAGGSGNCSC